MKYIKYKVPFSSWMNGYGFSRGWGNGYVAITKEHPFFGKDYTDKISIDPKDAMELKSNGNILGMFCADKYEIKKGNIGIDILINVHCGVTLSKSGENVANNTAIRNKELQKYETYKDPKKLSQ